MIVVDDMRLAARVGRLNARWSHLYDDAGDLDALHAFAAKLGLRRAWFQNDGRLPHYDLTESKRALAVRLGAKEVSWRDTGRTVKKLADVETTEQR